MPNRTFYIKQDDVDAWDKLDNKSQFVSKALQADCYSHKIFDNAPLQNGRIVKENEDGTKLIHFDRFPSDPTYTDPEDVA